MRTKQEKRMNVNSMKWIVCFMLLPSCWTQFLCPDFAEFGSSLLLTCARSGTDTIFINTPYGKIVTCFLSQCDTQDIRLDNTTVNITHVILEVNNVQEKDGGTWTCGPRDDQTPCNVTVFHTSCNISSEADTDTLHIGEEIRLSVTTEGHFCSDLIDFQLQTGNVTEKVADDLRVDVADSTDVFNSTFNISDSHIGSVQLLFTCNTTRKIIPCGGVKSLRLQSCNIGLREHTDDMYIYAAVDKEISLEALVEEYSCNGNLSYFLLAGDVAEELKRRNDTGNIYESTFNVTKPHFGPVCLQLTCNDVNRNISCEGVQSLVKTVMTQGYRTHKTAAIVAGSIATLVIIIIAVGLITRYMLTTKTSTMDNESCPYADVADSVHARPKNIRPDNGAYEEITVINGSFGNTVLQK